MDAPLALHQVDLDALCRRFSVRRLELFGSAATGRNRSAESDLDFIVDFSSFPPGGYVEAYFGLLESLETLFGTSVDLVVASAIKNPYFREAVEATKVLLYAG